MNARVTISEADLAQARRETGWSDKRTEVARLLYESGKSATVVACQLGNLTRNAVIGKMCRLGVAGPNGTHSAATRTTSVRARKPSELLLKPRVPRAERFCFAPKVRKAVEPPPPPVVDSKIPPEQRRQLVDLDASVCHWPVGDPGAPDFFFCGAAIRIAPEGSPPTCYCAPHWFRSIDRSERRRSERAASTASTQPRFSKV